MRITTATDLGRVVRSRRKALKWSQGELARLAGVSRWWINEFESGKPRAELDLVLRAVDALDLVLDVSDAAPAGVVGGERTARETLDDLLSRHIDLDPEDGS
ncbi:hypothetical protein BH23ACT10_BH23ACT10_24530 [soil metagenome]